MRDRGPFGHFLGILEALEGVLQGNLEAPKRQLRAAQHKIEAPQGVGVRRAQGRTLQSPKLGNGRLRFARQRHEGGRLGGRQHHPHHVLVVLRQLQQRSNRLLRGVQLGGVHLHGHQGVEVLAAHRVGGGHSQGGAQGLQLLKGSLVVLFGQTLQRIDALHGIRLGARNPVQAQHCTHSNDPVSPSNHDQWYGQFRATGGG